MKLTRIAGVCYDLEKTPYITTLGMLTFYFSSKMHLEKFLERFKDNRAKINESLSNRFNIHFSVDSLADILLYKSIETRGFYIRNHKGKFYMNINQFKIFLTLAG